ncbi:MAG: histidine--tRNA ligase [Bacillota bacterium]|nr:histidine--tRNA ligase [Bacillota bacterium]
MQRPRGTQDVLPGAVYVWEYVEHVIRQVCRCYHYLEVRTPIFEHTELFERTTGETTDIVEKQMYTFRDRGGRSLTLRPEGTAPVARAYLEASERPLLPWKVFYLGPMFRHERPQAGRFRQFVQFGVEAFGADDPALDGEVIALARDLFERLGLEGLSVHLNSIGCPRCRPSYREALLSYFRGREGLCPDCTRRLEVNPLRLLDCKEPSCRALVREAPRPTDFLCPECRQHFATVQEFLGRMGIPFVLDPTLVRGLDYYTRTVFEIMHGALGAQSTVCAGGRYDGLVEQLGGDRTPGVGFAAGLERIITTLELEGRLPAPPAEVQVMVVYAGDAARPVALDLLYRLRGAGWQADIDYLGRSLRAQMKHASRLGAPLVAMVGEDEVASGEVTVRDMRSGDQVRVPAGSLEAALRRYLPDR